MKKISELEERMKTTKKQKKNHNYFWIKKAEKKSRGRIRKMTKKKVRGRRSKD